ncbi:MAG: PRC-barrel domain containing protein [Rhodoferax sp.]|uniref:PRC-barrel domain-containing protein n=1 Tax=Rhodoferax sp. TaxID=50421 RepID=UPI001401584F|nr:PRC-barrel domain-containing protein [Rhodoferax sp.]NDP40392.1 PRC-barrel domain containing protein [Rhodoferax sp.]
MLHQTKDLQNLSIGATDGAIGDVTDFYFDDDAWVIRYLVVDAGSWLSSRKVLISPIATGKPDWEHKRLPVSLTREQVKNSPDIDTNMPVTRQHETDYLDYYSYPYYWGGLGLWGRGGYPNMLLPEYAGYGSDPAARAEVDAAQARTEARQRQIESESDPHLRSCNSVVGYHIEASDGEIGHVQGMLVDDESWAIRYLVVNTSNWWLGHDVLVAPQWVKSVSWAEQIVAVDLTRDALKQAPIYDPTLPLAREMEIAVYQHYGRAGYWPGAPALAE